MRKRNEAQKEYTQKGIDWRKNYRHQKKCMIGKEPEIKTIIGKILMEARKKKKSYGVGRRRDKRKWKKIEEPES